MIRLKRPACPNLHALAKNNYKHKENKDALRLAAHDKCMYCESKISHIDYAHIEHIKPKASDKFPDLAYEWDNLGYACSKCNNNKSDKYYINLPFINPYTEDPKDHIYAFGALVLQRNGSERGEVTIREIELNRVGLLEKRQERILEIQKALDACHRTQNEQLRQAAQKELLNEAVPNKEYSLVIAAMLDTHNNKMS